MKLPLFGCCGCIFVPVPACHAELTLAQLTEQSLAAAAAQGQPAGA